MSTSTTNNMLVSGIVAIGKQRQMGLYQDLPWRLSSDLKRFKKLTMGHHLIMGRKTYDSIKRPLPGRVSIVISRSPVQTPSLLGTVPVPNEAQTIYTQSLESALQYAKDKNEQEVFICGGAEIFKIALERQILDFLYLTIVDYQDDADTFFPEYQHLPWTLIKEEKFPSNENENENENEKLASTFQILKMK